MLPNQTNTLKHAQFYSPLIIKGRFLERPRVVCMSDPEVLGLVGWCANRIARFPSVRSFFLDLSDLFQQKKVA